MKKKRKRRPRGIKPSKVGKAWATTKRGSKNVQEKEKTIRAIQKNKAIYKQTGKKKVKPTREKKNRKTKNKHAKKTKETKP